MKRKISIKPYIYLAPAIILALLFYAIPFLKALISSFLTIDRNGVIKGFAGLENYKTLFTDASFINAIERTLLFTALFVPLNTLLILLASALTRRKNRFSFLPEYIFFMPMAFSLSAASLVFSLMFRGRVSIINTIFHINVEWLSQAMPAMLVYVFLGVFLDFGIDYILLLSAFRSSDKSVIEAARLDGATGGKLFFRIELPMAMEIITVIFFLAIKDALLIVAPITIITEGGPLRSTETIMFYYYIEAFKSGNLAIGNTITVTMVFIASIVLSLSLRTRRRNG